MVYPVRANAETKIRTVYYQPLDIDTGVGKYLYPMEEGGVDDAKNAFWTMNPVVTGRFAINVTLKSGVPVQDLRVPGYETEAAVNKISESEWSVTFDKPEGHSLLKDFLFYRSNSTFLI